MKLIIDIPEEVKHKVYAHGLSLCPNDKEQLINAIMNGTPLPKGHGRLIDADAYAKKFDTNINGRIGEEYVIAPTIIEADKEQTE